MATITNYTCRDENGKSVLCDAHGNNAAIQCDCGVPILITASELEGVKKRIGKEKSAPCPNCGKKVWVDIGDGELIRHIA